MFGQSVYHGLTKKYVTLFGSIFNDIIIERMDSEGDVVQTIKVPLMYGPKEKYIAKILSDPNLSKQIDQLLPRMSFEITDFSYDNDRKLNTTNRRSAPVSASNTANQYMQYSPVPYNINMNLSILVKNVDDGLKIVEQILPYFTPDWTVPVTLIPSVNETKSIPIILNSINYKDNYEGDYKEKRIIEWTLGFTMKVYY